MNIFRDVCESGKTFLPEYEYPFHTVHQLLKGMPTIIEVKGVYYSFTFSEAKGGHGAEPAAYYIKEVKVIHV